MRTAGWLKPTVQVKRKTEFNLKEVLQAYARLSRQGYEALLKDEALALQRCPKPSTPRGCRGGRAKAPRGRRGRAGQGR